MKVIASRPPRKTLLQSASVLEKISLSSRPGIYFTIAPFIELGTQSEFAASFLGQRRSGDSTRLAGFVIIVFDKDGQQLRRYDERANSGKLELMTRRLSVEFHAKAVLGQAIARIHGIDLFQMVLETEPDDQFFEPLHKRRLDPTNKEDFDQLNRELARSLRGKTNPIQGRAIEDTITAMGVQLAGLTATQIDTLAATAKLAWDGVPADIESVVTGIFRKDIDPFYKAVRNKDITTFKFDIPRDIDLSDIRLKESIIRDQANFARDEFFRRSDDISDLARQIVAKGNDLGLGNVEIGAALRQGLRAEGAFKQESYWNVIANVFQNRTRTAANLKTYNDVGVTEHRIIATLDRQTTEICRYMDGRILSVRRGLDNFREVEGETDPEEVKRINPFIRIIRQEDGSRNLMVRNRTGGGRKRLATIVRSGLGRRGDRGTFKNSVSNTSLMNSGVHGPPYHGKCRTISVPVL